MQWIEYKDCRIAISPADQGGSCWGAVYHVAHNHLGATVQGMFDGSQATAEEASLRAMRVVKVAIDEATDLTHEFPAYMSRLNEQFVL